MPSRRPIGPATARTATTRTVTARTATARLTTARLTTAAVLAAIVALPVPAYASADHSADHSPKYVAGSAGLGDPLFPLAGNGGYDVSHYGLRLRYEPATHRLTGSATISATATENLNRFDLDLRGFTVSRLTVNGAPASVRRDGQELIVTPRGRLSDGQRFTVAVNYAGVPDVITDPDGSIEGWVPTDDGAFVVGEPQGSPGWYPVNDNPRDKATFDVTVSVPAGLTVVANGVLVSRKSTGGETTFGWRESSPMAPYLATATLGRFDLSQYHVGRTPAYVAVDPTFTNRTVLDKLPSIVDFYTSIYGRYPFDAVGAIVDNAPDVGYSLETQTKPVFDHMPSESTLAHELSHQWFGDAVTLRSWPDIWLHEGFATWSEWIWSEHEGQATAQQLFTSLYNQPADDDDLWTPPTADPGDPANLFGTPVYDRGAMTLQALRAKVGDTVFFRILRDWIGQHRYGNATTPEFIALAEHDSHRDLRQFFHVWLYQTGKPTSW